MNYNSFISTDEGKLIPYLLPDVPLGFISSVSDTNSIDLTVTGTDLTADLRYQTTGQIVLAVDGSGLKATFVSNNISQFTNDSGYITTTGITPAALTKIDDTNVTLTLGGTPTTALLQATSLTLGWTGTLADARITSATNWNTAYTDRIALLTTIGSSGVSTLITNVLNIPNYSIAGLSPLTTKGDLFTYSTVNTRLGIGADATILIADSTQTTGNKWIAISSDATIATSGALTLANTAVTATSYIVNGGALFTVDSKGRLTSASNVTITTTGTSNKIDVSGGTGITPTITISPTYIGQSSITTLGTITTGIWNGTKLSEIYGGTNQSTYTTGDTLYASAANTLSKLAVGSNGQVLTLAAGIPSWATPSTGGITIGTTTITSGTNTKVLYDNSGVVGEYTISGSGNVAMTTSPTFVTPVLGTPTSGTLTNCTGLLIAGGGTGNSSYTQGDIEYYNSGTAFSKLAKDTNSTRYLSNQGTSNNPSWNQVDLTTGITGILPAANGGNWILISSQTASSSATIDFTGLSSTYKVYMVMFQGVTPQTDATNFSVRVGTGGTPTYQTGAVYGAQIAIAYGATTISQAGGTGNAQMGLSTLGTGANDVCSGSFTVFNPSQSTKYHQFISSVINHRDAYGGSNQYYQIGGHEYESNTAVTAIRFYMSSGNLATGVFYLYGIQ